MKEERIKLIQQLEEQKAALDKAEDNEMKALEEYLVMRREITNQIDGTSDNIGTHARSCAKDGEIDARTRSALIRSGCGFGY